MSMHRTGIVVPHTHWDRAWYLPFQAYRLRLVEMVAELLDLPCVTNVCKLEISGGTGRAERQLEGASEVVEFPLPALLTIDDGLNKERLPSLKGIMAAKKKPLDVKPAQLGDIKVSVTKMVLPPERAAGRILGDSAAAVPELVRLLQTEAKVL